MVLRMTVSEYKQLHNNVRIVITMKNGLVEKRWGKRAG